MYEDIIDKLKEVASYYIEINKNYLSLNSSNSIASSHVLNLSGKVIVAIIHQ